MENTVNLINSAETCIGIFIDGHYADKVTMSVETVLRRIKSEKMILPQEVETERNIRSDSNIVMSVLKGYPIGQIFTKYKGKDTYEIIHGQVKIKALNDFVNNEFPINPKEPNIPCYFKDNKGNKIVAEYNISDKLFKDLPEALQNAILWYNLDIVKMYGFENMIGG